MNLSLEDIRNQTTGAWPQVLATLGVDVPDSPNKHAPCPGCGGTDRFRFDDKDGRGTFVCGGGGDLIAGDGFDLLQHVFGYDFSDSLQAVNSVLSGCEIGPMPPVSSKPKSTGKRIYALELWLKANKSDPVVAAHPYLKDKGFRFAHGAGVVNEKLVIPIRQNGTGNVIAVQVIWPSGDKKTYGSMSINGTPGYLMLGNPMDRHNKLFVCEGWADVVSVVFLAYRGNACAAVAFGLSRLEKVAEQLLSDIGRMPTIVEDEK